MTYSVLSPLDFQQILASDNASCVDIRAWSSESIPGARLAPYGSPEWEQLVIQQDKSQTLLIFGEREDDVVSAAQQAEAEGINRVCILAGGVPAWTSEELPLEYIGAARWNKMYDRDGILYGRAPVPFFSEQLSAHPPGRILLPADGESRNGVWAAMQGWQVDVFDISARAREKALSFADAQGVTINYTLASFDDPGLPKESYDMAALFYAHVPPHLRRAGLEHIREAVKPSGYILVEAFVASHIALGHPYGPKLAENMYSVEELGEVFAGWAIEALGEHLIQLDAGRHNGPGRVVRMIARKPSRA